MELARLGDEPHLLVVERQVLPRKGKTHDGLFAGLQMNPAEAFQFSYGAATLAAS